MTARVLCFGDSNTWGYIPGAAGHPRLDFDERWPGVLTRLSGVEAVEAGLCGRTAWFDDPRIPGRNGLAALPGILAESGSLDFAVVMLGTNDLKEVFHKTAAGIAKDAGRLVETIKKVTKEKQGFVPKIILVSPPLIGEDMPSSVFSTAFAPRSIEESKLFSENFQAIAEEKGCRFFDAARYAPPSKEDSLHFNEAAHRALALALFPVVWEEATCGN